MKPKIIQKEAMLIAGVAGSGDETAKAWEAFTKIQKIHPLTNQVGEEGYEIRLYHKEGSAKIHVGARVKDAAVPREYKIFYLPAAIYAEFEIYPSKGWESSNDAMSKWLEENADIYKEAMVNGLKYGIEVYDSRYRGDKDPKSVVGMWIPLMKTGEDFTSNVMKMVVGQISEIEDLVKQCAGADTCAKVMAGKDELFASPDPDKGAFWLKEAFDRMDNLVDEDKRKQIMSACGRNCNRMNFKDTEECRQMRIFCATEEEYIDKFIMTPGPGNGVRYERDGKTLIQYYTPRKYGQGVRCYCYLMGKLPDGVNASPTYCLCSRSFVQAHWEGVLGRPVKVELGKTALTGSEECQFTIHL